MNKMFRRNFKVKGEDVDDFMVMQENAYQSYTSSILSAYLFEKGYAKQKRKTINFDLQEFLETKKIRKHLMFMQDFFINMELLSFDEKQQKLIVRNSFFNASNELCVTAKTSISWFEHA
ncbi:hypothetical protein [uncultured Aquimarina sp.]|uniref:hypothetical protein n=1 Tax=uncultured Aquimarina sp. TaxID=575652 RepID=UPI00261807E7|nr:hypothetical protein [uncultured Aquimarina sp.]